MRKGLRTQLLRFQGTRGQTLVEYALILSLVSVLAIVVLSAMGVEIRSLYFPIINALQAAQQAIQ